MKRRSCIYNLKLRYEHKPLTHSLSDLILHPHIKQWGLLRFRELDEWMDTTHLTQKVFFLT